MAVAYVCLVWGVYNLLRARVRMIDAESSTNAKRRNGQKELARSENREGKLFIAIMTVVLVVVISTTQLPRPVTFSPEQMGRVCGVLAMLLLAGVMILELSALVLRRRFKNREEKLAQADEFNYQAVTCFAALSLPAILAAKMYIGYSWATVLMVAGIALPALTFLSTHPPFQYIVWGITVEEREYARKTSTKTVGCLVTFATFVFGLMLVVGGLICRAYQL